MNESSGAADRALAPEEVNLARDWTSDMHFGLPLIELDRGRARRVTVALFTKAPL